MTICFELLVDLKEKVVKLCIWVGTGEKVIIIYYYNNTGLVTEISDILTVPQHDEPVRVAKRCCSFITGTTVSIRSIFLTS